MKPLSLPLWVGMIFLFGLDLNVYAQSSPPRVELTANIKFSQETGDTPSRFVILEGYVLHVTTTLVPASLPPPDFRLEKPDSDVTRLDSCVSTRGVLGCGRPAEYVAFAPVPGEYLLQVVLFDSEGNRYVVYFAETHGITRKRSEATPFGFTVAAPRRVVNLNIPVVIRHGER